MLSERNYIIVKVMNKTSLFDKKEHNEQALQASERRNEMFDALLDQFTRQYIEKQKKNREYFARPEIVEKIKKIRERIPECQRGDFVIPEPPVLKILRERYDEQNQIKLMKYMSRVQKNAGEKMLSDENFAKEFLEKNEFNAVVLSLDIRRSTELMLKAESPQMYAEFINTLTEELTESVKERFGIYDKFTGDGLLAFFPDFYSGEQAILHVLQCADDCHKIFEAVFSCYRNRFAIGGMPTGLGIGIDCGGVFKAGIELEYTVVGKPVVYACRLSGAPANHTYLTPAAAYILKSMNTAAFSVQKTTIEIKHEGLAEVYDVAPSSELALSSLSVEAPAWCAV